MANTRQELGRAFELIRQDKVSEAMQIVKPITVNEPDNADAWWLFANAASEPRDARRALINVLKINPSYPKAHALLDQLNEMHPPRDDELMMLMELEDAAPAPPMTMPEEDTSDAFAGDDDFQLTDSGDVDIDDLFKEAEQERRTDAFGMGDDFGAADEDDPFAELLDEDAAPRKARGGGRLLRVLLLLLIIVVGAAAAFVLLTGGEDEQAADQPTGSGDLVAVTADTVNPDLAEQLEQVRQATEAEVQAEIGTNATVMFVQVADGYSLVVRVCSSPSPNVPELVVTGMDLVSRRVGTTTNIRESLAQVGVSVQDCDRGNDILYRASSPISAVIELTNSPDFDAAFPTFRQSWIIES